MKGENIMKKNKTVQIVDSMLDTLYRKRSKTYKKESLKLYALKYIPLVVMFFALNMNFLIKGFVIFLYWVVITMFFDHRVISVFEPTIRIWFGVPGSGKTSVGAWLSKNSIKNHYRVLSNVQIKGTYKLEEEDLGKYDMSFGGEGCHVIYDEATINGLDNRQFKKFAQTEKPRYFSIHRHMENRVDVFSQDYDVDLKVKGRAGQKGLFHLTRLPINGFVMYRRIKKIFFIKKDDKQFVDGYEYAGLPRICYTRSVWGSFDTLDKSLCPKEQKEWELWHFDD